MVVLKGICFIRNLSLEPFHGCLCFFLYTKIVEDAQFSGFSDNKMKKLPIHISGFYDTCPIRP